MVQQVFHCDNYFYGYGNFNVFDNDNANVGNPCLMSLVTTINYYPISIKYPRVVIKI